MIKAFSIYLIIPCILLLGGYGQVPAHAGKGSTPSHSIPNVDQLAKLQQIEHQVPNFSIQTAKSGAERGKRKRTVSVFERAEELDERVSFKRHSNRNFNSITVYNTQEPSFIFHPIEKRSPSYGYTHFISPTYQSHLLLQVFRI